MTRRSALAWFAGYVAAVAFVLVTVAWLEARVRLDRLRESDEVKRIESRCVFYNDGSSWCAPRTHEVTTTTTGGAR